MKSYLLSIVLPIYNVEMYLEECVKSIISNENNKDIEILLIDDGSTDNCPNICDKLAHKNNNIKVYHKKNGGLSDARNYGLLKAKGEYIWFVDSDDKINSDELETIIEILKNNEIDVLLGDSRIINENSKIIDKNKFEYKHKGLKSNLIYSGRDIILNQIRTCDYYQTTVWLGIYRKQFLIDNVLFFEKGLIHEDELWTPKVLTSSKFIMYIDKTIYYYRIRENSIMREKKNNEKHIKSFIYIFSTLTDYFNWKIDDKELLANLNDNIAKRYLHDIISWEFVEYNELMKKVDKKKIFKQSKTKRNKIRAFILLISPKIYANISKMLKKRKG